MQLVIEIDEEKYIYAKNQVEAGIDNPWKIIIANGIPLPRGYGRLKDVDKIEALLDLDKADNKIAKALRNIIESVPTIMEADKESEDNV